MEQITPKPTKGRTRILFVVTKSVLGGAQRYVYDLAVSLPRDTYDVAVAYGGTGVAGSDPGILQDMLIGAGVRTIHIPLLGRDIHTASDKATYEALCSLFATEKPDIVHLNSPKAGGLGALAAHKTGVKKIIYTAHGWAFTERISPLARIARFFISYATILLCDHVICVSKSDYRAVAWLPFVKQRLHTIHNGIRHMSCLSRDEARTTLFSEEEIRRHADDLWIVSVAELTPNKNLFRAIEAVRIANKNTSATSLFYSIIGEGEQHEALEQYIQANHDSNSVRLLGFIPESRHYLAGFDGVLFPSIKEGLPYAVLEAGMEGLPIVASKTGGIPDIIEHGETGFLIENPRSPLDIATQISRLRDSGLRQYLGTALQSRIESNFSFEEMRNKTIALY